MKCLSPEAKKSMAKIFSLVNMSELPALSDNVTELLSLLGNKNSTTNQLTQVILKDVSLTSKVLQVVNSAFYSRGTRIGSVDRAISLVGLATIHELATSIAIFENFTKAGGDKKEISNLLTKSYLAGNLAKTISINKKLRVCHDEAFICSLFHNLGELIVLIYLPDLYRKIEAQISAGQNQQYAARKILHDLTFYQVGMEIADFWNLQEKIIYSMHPKPPKLRHSGDKTAILMNVAAFSNQITEVVNNCGQISPIIQRYYPTLKVTQSEALAMLSRVIDSAGHTSNIIQIGLQALKLHKKITAITNKKNEKYIHDSTRSTPCYPA